MLETIRNNVIQTIGNYFFEYSQDAATLKYKVSGKYGIDILIQVVRASGPLVLAVWGCYVIYNGDPKWYHILITSVLLILNYFFIIDLLDVALQPFKPVLKVDKTLNLVNFRKGLWRSQSIEISKIRRIEYGIRKEYVQFSSETRVKGICSTDMYFITNDNHRYFITTFSPSEIIDYGYYHTEKQLIKNSRKLVKSIAKEMGVLSQWNGINEE